MTGADLRVWVAVLFVLGVVSVVLVLGHAAAAPGGVVLACRDMRGIVVARYTTRGLNTMDGTLELSVPQGTRIEAQCSIQ